MLSLKPRLKTAAGMMIPGIPLVDIGTDHAYLPAFLIRENIVPSAIAGDIGEKPLQNARLTVEEYNLGDRITLTVSDGLKDISFSGDANISICGMGGTLIAEILEAAPEIKRKGIHLVLQPMTHSEDVRLWLAENSFEITEEKCVFDTGKIYCCMSADFCPENRTQFYEGFYYFGTLDNDSEENSAFISSQYKRIKTKLDALTAADKAPDDIEKLTRIVSYYKERYTK